MDSEWKKVNEIAPPLNVPLLVSEGENIWVGKFWKSTMGTMWITSNGCTGYDLEDEFDYPTHWKELPDLPKI